MKLPIIYLSFALMLSSCGGTKTETVTEEQEETEETNAVSLTSAQITTAQIAMGSIEMKNLNTSIKVTGNVSVPNHNKALVTSVTNGVIKTLLVHAGHHVSRGEVIATIINTDAVHIQQQLQATNAQITLTELDYNRQKELVAGNAAPLKNVQRAEAELTTLRSTRNSLQKQLIAYGISPTSVSKGEIITTIPVRAPISGNIIEVTAQIGSNVDASTPIAQIVNNEDFHVELFVFEKDLAMLQPGQNIQFTLTNNQGITYSAKIYSIGSVMATESKTVPIHAVVQGNTTGLIDGMNVTAAIRMGTALVSAVPSTAVVSNAGQDYIFVVSKESPNEPSKEKGTEVHFERIPVQKGVTDMGYTEITPIKELAKDAKIVTTGAFFIMAKMVNTGEE